MSTRYTVSVTLASGEERTTSSFSTAGDAMEWAIGYLRGLESGREAWVLAHEGLKIHVEASYEVDVDGRIQASGRALQMNRGLHIYV